MPKIEILISNFSNDDIAPLYPLNRAVLRVETSNHPKDEEKHPTLIGQFSSSFVDCNNLIKLVLDESLVAIYSEPIGGPVITAQMIELKRETVSFLKTILFELYEI
jgi:hypothetical protein